MLITAKNVVKKFDKFTALNHYNMNVPEGSIYGLVGPNGSGKTTTIKHLIGMYKQDEGEILVNDEKVYDNEKVKSKTPRRKRGVSLCRIGDYFCPPNHFA